MSVNFWYYKIFIMLPNIKASPRRRRCFYSSQPSISRMIKILEQGAGLYTFHRTRKGVALTRKGRTFDHVAPACEELFVGEELLSHSAPFRVLIRIGASETALRCFSL